MTRNIICLILSGLIIFSSAGCGGSSSNFATNNANVDVWELVKEAYIYSFPLVIMDATKTAGTNTVKSTNKKAPVNHTVYSQLFIDLANDSVVIHKPASTRFHSLEIMNAWSDCEAILGTGGDTDNERTYIITGPNFTGDIPDGMTQVKLATSMGWILGRTICNGDDDLENVYAIQANLTAKTLTAYLNNSDMPDGVYNPEYEGLVPINYSLSLSAKDFFDKVNALLEQNPPYPDDSEVIERISAINIGAGLVFDDSILNDDSGSKWQDMKNTVREELRESIRKYMIQNGVFQNYGEPIARFGTAYDYRTMIAIAAFGANPVDIAIYPRAETDNNGESLNGSNSYILHFSELPPVKDKGFWSMTAYNDDNFLIDNELNRYCINDRSNFTLNQDGTLDVYLQANRPDDESKVNNWLPTGSEGFHLYMRIYLPQDRALDPSKWKAPTITKVN